MQANKKLSRSELIDDFLACADWAGAERRKLAGDASFRHYERVYHEGRQAVLMDAPPEKEDTAPFIQVAEYLVGEGYSAPRIWAKDEANGFLLLEDLGDDSFTKVLAADKHSEMELYGAATDVLVAMHTSNRANPVLPAYDEDLLLREVSLFCDWFMPAVMGDEKAAILRDEYLRLWRDIIRAVKWDAPQFVHRDYHADNLMWLPERQGMARVGMLDFQDAVLGSCAYDMVSFLEDARRDVAPATVEAALTQYIKQTGVDRAQFMTWYHVLGAQRNSKIIGIFTRLKVRDGKQQYLSFLPRVWGHLERDITHPALASLKTWLDKHIRKEWRGEIKI